MFKRVFALSLIFCAFTLTAQSDVVGIIIDKTTNTPIIGATVIIKNTNKGTTTDFDGNFSLFNVSEGATLVFSYLGYITQEIVLESNNISVFLEPSISELNEVILVGYGSQA